ncbi:hypothetical protein [Leifsonia shinshuensis]|uniref:hypothetical protein n=1 Tax=Leifsonia TaxID=110932 RepID=UPI00285B5D5E|nr:hypothetical protein [Leifsonia shinshuensis]MDR6970544.1 hypothetical protein [Leifsonia shinshuensis]
MKTVATRSASFHTGTAIAEAVQSYALELARRGQVDVVDIPVALPGGGVGRAAFMVGWLMDASTVDTATADAPVTEHEASVPATDRAELADRATLDDLRTRSALLAMPHGVPFSFADLAADWPDLDMDFPAAREHS